MAHMTFLALSPHFMCPLYVPKVWGTQSHLKPGSGRVFQSKSIHLEVHWIKAVIIPFRVVYTLLIHNLFKYAFVVASPTILIAEIAVSAYCYLITSQVLPIAMRAILKFFATYWTYLHVGFHALSPLKKGSLFTRVQRRHTVA